MWHGPFQHEMAFNSYDNTITGYGVDIAGEFHLRGRYSTNTLQIQTFQKYTVRNLFMIMNKLDAPYNSDRFPQGGQLQYRLSIELFSEITRKYLQTFLVNSICLCVSVTLA